MNPSHTDWTFTRWEVLRSIFLYVRSGLVLLVIMIIFFPLAFIVKKRSFDGLLRRAARVFLRAVGVRVVSVQGLENIDPDESYIVTPNHVNFLEPFIYQGYFPKLLRGLEKKENFRIPIWGLWMRAIGQLEVDREDSKKAIESMKEVARVLREERTSVLVAPEGTRTPNGRLQPFKRGPFKTAAVAGVRLMPMCCIGLYEINRKGDWRIKPGPLRIVFGTPLGPPDESLESQHALSAELRRWMLTQLEQEDPNPTT